MNEDSYLPPEPGEVQSTHKEVIDPREVIAELSVRDLNHFSNEYYRLLPFPDHQLGKPFTMVTDTAQILHRLGLLLEGLRLGPAMTVLDFGSGTCWLAKMLWQMGCSVIATDVSEEALQMGRRLFEDFPVPMLNTNAPYRIVPFDGFTLQVDDSSVDRIICYDTFHHVPNQEDVVSEFARVLRPGGIIALNEPIGPHSIEPASQSEMRVYTVLENDLRMDEVLPLFERHGLIRPRFKLSFTPEFELDLDEYQHFVDPPPEAIVLSAVPDGAEVETEPDPVPVGDETAVSERVLRSIRDRSIGSVLFYLQKGDGIGDSRRAEGLAHEIEIFVDSLELKVNELVHIDLRATNTGTSYWMHSHPEGVGMVKVGTQLLDRDRNALVFDLDRGIFQKDIYPGEAGMVKVPIRVDRPGEFTIGIDLVSDHITWFKMQGSTPLYLDVTILE